MKSSSHAVPHGMFTKGLQLWYYTCGKFIQRVCVLTIISCRLPCV